MKRILISYVFFIIFFNCTAQSDLIPVRVGKYYGYANLSGELVINPTFAKAYRFANGLAVVQDRNVVDQHGERMFGYINSKGEYVIGPKYVRVSSFESNVAVVTFVDKYNRGVIDKKGNTLYSDNSKGFRIISYFEDGVARVYKTIKGRETSEKAYINTKGEYVSKPMKTKLPAVIEKVIDGRTLVSFDFVDNIYPFYYAPRTDNTKWGLANGNWDIIQPPIYDNIKIFNKDLIFIKLNGGLWSAINSSGKEIIKPKFDDITNDFDNGEK